MRFWRRFQSCGDAASTCWRLGISELFPWYAVIPQHLSAKRPAITQDLLKNIDKGLADTENDHVRRLRAIILFSDIYSFILRLKDRATVDRVRDIIAYCALR